MLGASAVLIGAMLYTTETTQDFGINPSLNDSTCSRNGTYGLTNLGNTCFLNALLQAFSASDVFCEYIEATETKRTKTLDDRIAEELKNCLMSIRTGRASHNPEQFVSTLGEKFSGIG
jgi:ubiquitin C-terminal hydrolase